VSFAAIIISIVSLCSAAGLGFVMRKSRDKPDSAFVKAWFQGKSLRIFPVRSLAYAFFSAVIVFFGLLTVEEASGYLKLMSEDFIGIFMNYEKLSRKFEYPLIAYKGREEVDAERPKILVLGDSFVFGDGLTNFNQIWWNVMARELERRGYDCQVCAVGEPAIATYNEYLWLESTSLLEDIQPDLIIITYVKNDADLSCLQSDLPFLNFTERFSNLTAIHAWGLGALEKKPIGTVFPNMYAFVARKQMSKENGNREEEMIQNENLEIYNSDVLRPLGELIAHTGIPAIVFPTPEKPARKRFELLYRDVLPIFEQAGFPVYNPLDEFLERYPRPNRRQNKYFRASAVNQHPGPATSWFLGEYAADVIEREYACVLGEKRHGEKAYPIEINDWMPYMLDPRALMESEFVSQYVIDYPDQSSEPDLVNLVHGNFLTIPLGKKYVKLNFKYPVRLSSVKIEGEDLLSISIWTLGINEKLGFDDQKPVKWPRGRERRVTSLLISAKTVDGKQTPLTVTIEGEVVL